MALKLYSLREQGLNFRLGTRASFSSTEVCDDLVFAGFKNTYDDYKMPIACPRAERILREQRDQLRAQASELRSIHYGSAATVAIGGAAFMAIGFWLAFVLQGHGLLLTASLACLGLWFLCIGWALIGDIVAEETHVQPRWSVRATPLVWILPPSIRQK